MAEKVIKIQLENSDGRKENFYIKFYVDMIYPCIAKFRTKLTDRCPELATANFSVFWIDEDNDEIIIKNDDDLRFYGEQANAGKIVVRVQKPEKEVEKQQATQSSQEYFVPTSTPGNEPNKNEIHYGIICDECDGTITGYRYKCMQCADFDLCMKCENQMVHRNHLMIRISNENMKNLPARQNCKINLRQFAPRVSTEVADIEMATADAAPTEEKQKKGDRHRKGEPNLDEKCKQKRYNRNQSKQEAKEKKLEEKAKRHQERALRCRQKLDRCGRYTIPHFLSYMMDPANLGITAPEPEATSVNAEPAQQQQQQQKQQQPSSQSFRASASANLPANLGGAAASAHIGCPFSFASQPLQHIHQLNRTLSNFLNPLGVNVEFGLPNTVTTTTTTTSSAANGGDNNEKLTQTETRTDENSSQTQQQPLEEKLTQTDAKTTSTTSTSTSTTKMTSSSGAETVIEADIPTFVSQNRELFAKIAASAAAGAAHSADAAHAAIHSAEVASSLASSLAAHAVHEAYVEDCHDGEKSPTESINEEEAINSSFDDKLNTSEEDSVSVLSDSTHDNLDEWTYVYQQAFDKAEEATAQSTGAIPKVPSASKSPSVDFVQLSNDLKKHIEEQLCQEFGAAKMADPPVQLDATPLQLPSDQAIPMPAPTAPTSIPLRHHEKPHIDMAMRSMLAMGFNNEGAWLTRLLETVDGNIPRALEFLQPHK